MDMIQESNTEMNKYYDVLHKLKIRNSIRL